MSRLRAQGHQNCGIVLNFTHVDTEDSGPENTAAAARTDAIFNRWFVEAATKGHYPQAALDGFAEHMPKGWENDMAEISQPLDFLGVNYYTRMMFGHAADQPWPAINAVDGPGEKTQMGWEVYPRGLYETLKMLTSDYVGDLPIYVTENGMANADTLENGAVYDPQRISYIDQHLQAMHDAIADDVNLRGFFYWSLLDNYEWSFGYEKRFGLVHVDFDTMQRTPKASFHELKTAISKASS